MDSRSLLLFICCHFNVSSWLTNDTVFMVVELSFKSVQCDPVFFDSRKLYCHVTSSKNTALSWVTSSYLSVEIMHILYDNMLSRTFL